MYIYIQFVWSISEDTEKIVTAFMLQWCSDAGVALALPDVQVN